METDTDRAQIVAQHESDEGSGHSHATSSLKVLIGVLLLNGVFLLVEAAGGWVYGSLALLADAVHMLTDVSGLLIAILGQRLMSRAATSRHSFGFFRSEVLAGLGNGLLLVASGLWIVFEGVRRFGSPADANFDALIVIGIGSLGLVVNLLSAAWLHGRRNDSLNMRGAYLHMAVDALSSIAVIVAAGAIWLTGWFWLDPLMSIVIAVMVLLPACKLVWAALQVLMEATPRSVDVAQMVLVAEAVDGVADFHHVHVWQLAANQLALSAHVEVEDLASLHDAQLLSDELAALLQKEFAIRHATLALECHPCAATEG